MRAHHPGLQAGPLACARYPRGNVRMTSCRRFPLFLLLACTAACTAPDRGSEPAPDAAAPVDVATPATTDDDVLAGDSFRARGNEPFWAIDTEGDILHFVTPDMPDGRTLKGERIAHVKGLAFFGEDDGMPFNSAITRTHCDRKGADHGTSVAVRVERCGCGNNKKKTA